MKNRILVIGSINVDYVIHTHRLPALGETITGEAFSMNFGGKGANQAVAIAKAGGNVKMLGAVGRDLPGEQAVSYLESMGVDCSAVLRVEGSTGAAVITVCGGDNHIILDMGANEKVTPEVITQNAALFDWADMVVMQYEIPVESVLAAAKLAKERGKTVLINPAPVKEVPNELYSYVDLITPNEFEANLITGIDPVNAVAAQKAIRTLQALGCKNAVITLGSRGCAYSEGDRIGFAGIYQVARVDTTAAGDSFLGGICAKLCEGKCLADAVTYAAAVSAIAVSRHGAAASIPTAEEVENFLKNHAIGEFEG